MKVIIAGSRTITDQNLLNTVIEQSRLLITEVVSGGAEGVDTLGEVWARSQNIRITRFLPDWDRNGTAAGILRNIEMAKYADALIVLWDGESRGTKHMIDHARSKGMYVWGRKKWKTGEWIDV